MSISGSMPWRALLKHFVFMIQKLREALGLFISNFLLISKIVLTVWLPGSILLTCLLYLINSFTRFSGRFVYDSAEDILNIDIIELVFGPIYIGALIHALSRWKQGLTATYRESINYSIQRFSQFFRIRFITFLIIFAWTLAFIIPGIIFALRFALVDMIVVLEGLEGSDARRLSEEMTEGKRWKILWAFVLVGISTKVVAMILIYSSLSLFKLLPFFGLNYFIALIVSTCVSHILDSIIIIVLFLFYWEARSQRLNP
jgi:hypothetical protein